MAKATNLIDLTFIETILNPSGQLQMRGFYSWESTEEVHYLKKQKQKTCDMWRLTRDTWHMTHDRFGEVNRLPKFPFHSSYGLRVKMYWITELINDKGHFRKAMAKPGPLKI